MGKNLGQWAFIIGVAIAIVVGLFAGNLQESTAGLLVLLLVIFGLVVGFLNVTEKETTPFLVAAVALLLTGTAGNTLTQIPGIGQYLAGIVEQIAVFVTPAAIVVALKTIQALARN